VSLGLLGLANVVSWGRLGLFLIPLATLQITIAVRKSRWVRPELEKLETLTHEFVVLRQGLDLMEHQQFHSSKLESLVQVACRQDASSKLRKLEWLLSRIRQRKLDWVYLPSILLAVGTQLVLAIDRWRAEHQEDLQSWLDAWAEFDALNALACYAYEHPTAIFPELVDGAPVLEAKTLGHPLIAEDVCVGNDVALNGANRFYLVSGSNMAGKSTFLRAIGMNVVLAAAGAPVRAASATISVFAIGASISVTDSLLEGKSKFLAEVERLKETLDLTRGKLPVLFLMDEILSGTNSRDRRLAAESIVRSLLAGGAIGALSTHDLALTQIAELTGLQGLNMHMDSTNPNDPLEFDYKLKVGILKGSNALAIVEMMGIGSTRIP
jgi:DNA mismatch repair ATPase MutS